MKKRVLAAICTVLALAMVGCGKKEADETTTEAVTEVTTEATTEAVTEATPEDATEATTEEVIEEPTDYTFKDGTFENLTLKVNVPDGWTIDESWSDTDTIKIMKCADKDSYDSFNTPMLKIEISAFGFYDPNSEFSTLEYYVNNDKQFFDGEPASENITIGGFTGTKMSGQSISFVNKKIVYENLLQITDGDDAKVSKMHIDYEYVTDDELAEIEAIVESLEIVVTP